MRGACGEAAAAAAAAPSPARAHRRRHQRRGLAGRLEPRDAAPSGPGGAGPGRAALLGRRVKAPPPAPVGAGPPSWYLEECCARVSLAAEAGQRHLSAMKGGGIENPVFEPPSPGLGRHRQASPAGAGAGVAEAEAEEGPCGWGRCAPKALQLCNNPEGYLAAYSLLAIFQGNPSPPPCPEPQGCCPPLHLPCGTRPLQAFRGPGCILLSILEPRGKAGEEWWQFGWWVRGGRVPPAARVWCCCWRVTVVVSQGKESTLVPWVGKLLVQCYSLYFTLFLLFFFSCLPFWLLLSLWSHQALCFMLLPTLCPHCSQGGIAPYAPHRLRHRSHGIKHMIQTNRQNCSALACTLLPACQLKKYLGMVGWDFE